MFWSIALGLAILNCIIFLWGLFRWDSAASGSTQPLKPYEKE